MLKKFKKIIIVLVLVGLFALALVYFLTTYAEKKFAEGNSYLFNKQYKEAITSYEKSVNIWPFIKNNPHYNEKLKFANALSKGVKDKPNMTIYLDEKAPDEELYSLAEEISNKENVKGMKVINREDAYQSYKDRNRSNELLSELATRKMFPMTILVDMYEAPSQEHQNNIYTWLKDKVSVQIVLFNPIVY